MSNITPNEIENEAHEAFGFLLSMPGCRSEKYSVPWGYTVISYIFERLCLQVYLEYKDPTVDVRVCRTLDGRPPPAVLRVYNEQRVRLTLYEALMEGTEADRALGQSLVTKVRSLPGRGPERMVPEIHIYAGLLADAIESLTERVDQLFP
jgi:hypothetical protein